MAERNEGQKLEREMNLHHAFLDGEQRSSGPGWYRERELSSLVDKLLEK